MFREIKKIAKIKNPSGDGSREGDGTEQQMGERGKFVSTVPSRSSSNLQRRFVIRLTTVRSYGNGTVSGGIRG